MEDLSLVRAGVLSSVRRRRKPRTAAAVRNCRAAAGGEHHREPLGVVQLFQAAGRKRPDPRIVAAVSDVDGEASCLGSERDDVGLVGGRRVVRLFVVRVVIAAA